MQYKLSSTDVINAIKAKIREYIPEVVIPMPPVKWETGGIRPQPPRIQALNIFTEMGEQDTETGAILTPTGTDHFPYIFILEDRQLTGRERFADGVERSHYNSYFFITFYIDIEPFNRSRIPRLNETLGNVALDLQRSLKYLDIWGGSVETFNNRPTHKDENTGILHYFINVPYYEDTLLAERDPVEELDHEVILKDVTV